MNTDNITSKGITLNENGKIMQIEIYEQQIEQLTNNWNELEEWVKKFSVVNYNCDEIIVHEQIILNFVLTKMKEIKEKNNER